MNLPDGRLLRSRVVEDPGEALESALDRRLTGYAVLEPQDALLLDADATGVITFRDGAPVAAVHVGSQRGGPPALADLAVPGPYSLELRELNPSQLPAADESDRVPPGMPAERLAGDPDLARRARAIAPRERAAAATAAGDRTGDGPDPSSDDAVAAFLADEGKIEAIRDQARQQARERAEEWGLDDHLE